MKPKAGRDGFVIDGPPRCGSTTLARVLSCHPRIECLSEPFHPERCHSLFHRMAVSQRSAEMAVKLILCRWAGFKHVWDSRTGWPFPDEPEINDSIVRAAPRVVFLCRRNLLKRYVSGLISNQVKYWVGTREEFLARIATVQLATVDPQEVKTAIAGDQAALARRRCLLRESGIPFIELFYEDLYDGNLKPHEQRDQIDAVIHFLRFESLSAERFSESCAPLLQPDTHKWGSAEIYRLIPGVQELERQAGSDETGWLFK